MTECTDDRLDKIDSCPICGSEWLEITTFGAELIQVDCRACGDVKTNNAAIEEQQDKLLKLEDAGNV